MSDILEDLEIFGLGDEKFKHREEDVYSQISKKRGIFGSKIVHLKSLKEKTSSRRISLRKTSLKKIFLIKIQKRKIR